MYIDAKQRFPHLYEYSQYGNLNFLFHYEEDPRVTGVGAFLRRASIDELPNFLNVVLGDMSLVGPRPEVPELIAIYGKYRDEYLSVKPGVTCLSKISGRDHLTKEQSIQLDLGYIRTRSFKLDWHILWITAKSVLLRKNVFHGRSETKRRAATAAVSSSGPILSPATVTVKAAAAGKGYKSTLEQPAEEHISPGVF
jgi:lipopolysaccharide/colanic/teichoic acid biosynthesis glycosyltransferase